MKTHHQLKNNSFFVSVNWLDHKVIYKWWLTREYYIFHYKKFNRELFYSLEHGKCVSIFFNQQVRINISYNKLKTTSSYNLTFHDSQSININANKRC